MKNTTSCGGIVIHKGKILLLYKNYNNRYSGWVLPKGSMEDEESREETAVREVKEESGASAQIVSYVGETNFNFHVDNKLIKKTVHWFLMQADSFYTKPQREEGFVDSGYYKYHEAYYLLKFDNERDMLEKAYEEYKKRRFS